MRQTGIVCALAFLAAATSAAQGIKATVLAGAGGYVRSDCITPVMVILENDGRDREGELEVSIDSVGAPAARAVTRVDLPAQSRKAVFAYVPAVTAYAEHVRVQYRTLGGQELLDYRESLNASPAAVPVVGSIDRLPPSAPTPENADKSIRYVHLTLTPAQLPDRYEGLLMYDAFILSPAPAAPLPRTQVNALYEWVLRGGILIVDASRRTDSLLNGMLPEMLPFRPQGIDQVHFNLFGEEVPYAHGEVSRGAVLVESNGVPLVVRRNVGLGSVVCFAIDPGSAAWKNWPGHAAFWPDILTFLQDTSTPDTSAYVSGPEQRKQRLRDLVQTNRQTGLRMGLVIILIALYAAVVGPGDYWLVRKLGAPRLTFITFPAMVLVFTLAAWFGAKAWVGGEMSMAARQRLLYVPDENAAIRFHVASVFVPMIGDYEIALAGEAFVQPIRSFAFSPFESIPPQLDVDSGGLTQRIPGWQERVVYANDTAPIESGGLSLAVEAGGMAVRIENTSSHRLRNTRLLYGDQVWIVRAEIPSGNTIVPMESPYGKQSHLSWPEAAQVFAEVRPSRDDWGRSAEWREFRVQDALSRGALILIAEDSETWPSDFSVDGDPRPERAHCTVMAVTYPAQEGQFVAFDRQHDEEEEF